MGFHHRPSPSAGGWCTVYKEFSWLSYLLKQQQHMCPCVCIPMIWISSQVLERSSLPCSTSVTFSLLKVHLVTTSDMNGTCLGLQGMKIDSCGRSVKLSHIAKRECYFWHQARKLYLVISHVVTALTPHVTGKSLISNSVEPDYPVRWFLFLSLPFLCSSYSVQWLLVV